MGALRQNGLADETVGRNITLTLTIYNYNQASEYFENNFIGIHLVMPATYVIDGDI
jgi:hypothetical protein